MGFPRSSVGKESACNAVDLGSIPGLGRSPGEGNASPRQYSCLDRGVWPGTVNGVTKSRTWLSAVFLSFFLYCFPWWHHLTTTPTVCEGFNFSTVLPTLVIFFNMVSILMSVKYISLYLFFFLIFIYFSCTESEFQCVGSSALIRGRTWAPCAAVLVPGPPGKSLLVVLMCIFLMIVQQLFMHLLTICVSSLGKCLFKSFAHFLTVGVVIQLQGSLYILDINPFPIYGLQISCWLPLHSVDGLLCCAVFKFDVVPFIYVLLCYLCFWCHIQ